MSGGMPLSSLSNPRVKYMVRLCKSASYRARTGRFVLDGVKLCSDALRFGIAIDSVYYTEKALAANGGIIEALIASAENSFSVTPDVLKKIADTVTPQGVVCECIVPESRFALSDIVSGGRYVVLEDISDPANLGAIARSCEALGVDAVLIIGDSSCDMYSPKAQRAAMGALMRLPVAHASADELFAALAAVGLPTYAAALTDGALPLDEADFSSGAAVFIGNEGHGLSAETIEWCNQNLIIPIKGGSESLNAAAAAAIIAYILTR